MTASTRELIAAKAKQELADLHLLREVVKINKAGASQHAIADMLGVAQPTVHRMLKKARLDPTVLDRSPREAALEYAAGELSRRAMIEELSARDYTHGHVPEPESPISDAYVRGTWDEVTGAVTSRLIGDEEYREIVTRAERRRQRASA